ncbi:hypothetical protein GALMADRAFT_146636 [Galerina marginata CBS 339.88]|uniref:BTB domain-containing protein n=1 Tax=Galerina marginata (strain CBS 339.88) TaxID=685588 RepID=A0A067SN02_GALM3|nr:hypothetical protein GALMADRAFT_146636 [Galerina marginata CBS 339.88]
MVVPAQEAMKPWLELISVRATKVWQEDLKSLCLEAEHHFPDIVWHTKIEHVEDLEFPEKVWAHKAIVSARWTPSFKSRYLTRSPALESNVHGELSQPTFLPKDPDLCSYTAISYDLLQLYTAGSNKFDNENEFDISIHQEGLDSLRKDCIYMWRSRLYSDVCISLPPWTKEDRQSYAFWSHRFLLSSRSPYFHRVLSHRSSYWNVNEAGVIHLTLPSTHFTIPALGFILGYIYTGTLQSLHGYDIATALFILRGSLYLELPVLQKLILAEIVVKMLHGMYHAFLPDAEYSRLVDDNWATAVNLGCQCEVCAKRAPHVLQFALEEDIKSDVLERGARRALIGLFGEGWCTEEFAALPDAIKSLILTNVREMITPSSVLPMLFAAESALIKLENPRKDWGHIVQSFILSVRASIDNVLCANVGTCFKSQRWQDPVDISDTVFALEQVTWVLKAVLRSKGANAENGSTHYQDLRSSAYLTFQPVFNSADTDSQLSSGASFYSCISTPSRIASLFEEQENVPENYPYISALDLPIASLYSLASSRTVSTDYGMYYTRWAVSQEAISDSESIRTITRRASWNSFES